MAAARLLGPLVAALSIGGGFGALTSHVNAISYSTADLESRARTRNGWSVMEIISVLLDSGWAWAGLAVAVGWSVTRRGEDRPRALARGAAAGATALLAATAGYCLVDTVHHGTPLSSWQESEPLVWWVAGVVFGAPLGAVGACATRPGVTGLLARSTVPVGAAVQMVVLPPGRNAVITTVGQVIVLTAAAIGFGAVVVHHVSAERHRRLPADLATRRGTGPPESRSYPG